MEAHDGDEETILGDSSRGIVHDGRNDLRANAIAGYIGKRVARLRQRQPGNTRYAEYAVGRAGNHGDSRAGSR